MSSVVQVFPSRISITPKRNPLEFHKVKFNSQCWSYTNNKKAQAISNFKAIKNPFLISKASKRKIMDSINSMYMLSKPRKIEMRNKKFIYNYKMSFITLTLPATQFHSDTLIKSEALNHFLIELRKNYDIQNYLWKAELQANENIHFHLILDKYIDFQALRRRWNRILNKLGYIDKYREKMNKLTLTQYLDLRKKNADLNIATASKAYAQGKRTNWSNPNTVDVRSVFGKRDLASYLAKYITKSFNKKDTTSAELERQLKFGRSWARSYSLAKLKYQNKYLLENVLPLINYLRKETKHVKTFIGDFFTVFFFQPDKLNQAFKKFHTNFLFANAKLYNYPLPYS